MDQDGHDGAMSDVGFAGDRLGRGSRTGLVRFGGKVNTAAIPVNPSAESLVCRDDYLAVLSKTGAPHPRRQNHCPPRTNRTKFRCIFKATAKVKPKMIGK